MKKLKYYGGNGFEGIEDNGDFEVRQGEEIKTRFDSLQKAKEFYESLNCDKAIWDLTHIPELIECHTL